MEYREFTPSPALADSVKCFWTLEAEAGLSLQTIFPDGCTEIVFHYGDRFVRTHRDGSTETQPRAIFAGQIDRHLRIAPSGRAGTLGVRFHPGGARRFFREPQSEFGGSLYALADVWGPSLEQRVLEAKDTAARIAMVEAELLHRSRPYGNPVIDEALYRIRKSRGTEPIRQITTSLNVSPRQLERLFQREIGLNPKVFARIVRFQQVLHVMERKRSTWAMIALDCGYYDQAHLIREFEEFTGQTPSAYSLAGSEMSVAFIQDAPAFPV